MIDTVEDAVKAVLLRSKQIEDDLVTELQAAHVAAINRELVIEELHARLNTAWCLFTIALCVAVVEGLILWRMS